MKRAGAPARPIPPPRGRGHSPAAAHVQLHQVGPAGRRAAARRHPDRQAASGSGRLATDLQSAIGFPGRPTATPSSRASRLAESPGGRWES